MYTINKLIAVTSTSEWFKQTAWRVGVSGWQNPKGTGTTGFDAGALWRWHTYICSCPIYELSKPS